MTKGKSGLGVRQSPLGGQIQRTSQSLSMCLLGLCSAPVLPAAGWAAAPSEDWACLGRSGGVGRRTLGSPQAKVWTAASRADSAQSLGRGDSALLSRNNSLGLKEGGRVTGPRRG